MSLSQRFNCGSSGRRRSGTCLASVVRWVIVLLLCCYETSKWLPTTIVHAQERGQEQPHLNMFEQMWHKLQQATSQSKRLKVDEPSTLTKETKSTETPQAKPAKPHNPLARPTQQRRRALYRHSLSSHYGDYREKRASAATMDEYQTAWEAYSPHRDETLDSARLDRTTSLHTAWPPMPRSKVWSNRALVRRMFQHGYDSYMIHAYPAGEVHPVSCQPGTFDLVKIPALSLLDSLDTLLVLHNTTEFARACERLRRLEETLVEQYRHDHELVGQPVPMARQPTFFALNQNVSVFETNIRVLGGLLSAHQLALAMHLDRPVDSDSLEFMARHGIAPVRMDDVVTESGAVRWGTVLENDSTSTPQSEATESIDLDLSNDGATSRTSAACVSSRSLSDYDCAVQLDGVLLASTLSSAKKNYTKDADETVLSTEYWRYDGYLLDLALDIGTRLLPAFSTPTGIPYGTVNLLYGVPSGETPIASLAGGGTLTLEFELLSRLSGDARFGKAAKLASRALFRHRSQPLNLFGKHIDTRAGSWTETLSGIGSNSDSFIEYLAKHYILFPEDDDFWIMLKTTYGAIFAESRFGEWYADVEMSMGTSMGSGRRVLESLAAFYPGLQVLLGELAPAARSLNSFFMVREVLGYLPERFNYGVWNLDISREGSGIHPLRPELLESCYFMHRATKDLKAAPPLESVDDGTDSTMDSETLDQASGWQWAADFALHKLERTTRTGCGYASLRELKPQTTGSVENSRDGIKLLDEMPSYFLSETLKYLYLTFDDDNFLHRDDNHEWIFTTEAHPIHSVPTKRTPKTTASAAATASHEFANDVTALRKLLKSRLQEKRRPESQPIQSAQSKNIDLVKEKWTSSVDYRSYRVDIDGLVASDVSADHDSSINRTDTGSMEELSDWITVTVPTGPFVHDKFGETAGKSNAAHLSLGNWGSGRNIRKACRNVYSSGLWWMHALNGGSTDYSDTYISVGQDQLIDNVHSFTLLGAVEALGALGTGVYLGERENEDMLCPIVSPQDSTQAATANDDAGANEGTTVFPTDIGNFQVDTYSNGAGFQVHHEPSGEVLKVNVMHDFDDTDEKVVMVYSELRSSAMSPAVDKTRPLEKKVSILDFEGNTFTCEITLLRVFTAQPDVDGDTDQSHYESLLTMPCSSAMFGPSQFSLLKTQDEVAVEATLAGPSSSNRFGCSSPGSHTIPPIPDSFVLIHGKDGENDDNNDSVESVHPDEILHDRVVRVVNRGECSFYSKALDAKSAANAVIVVNNVDDEVFMMSSSEDEAKDVDPLDLPLTVLVSGLDGEAMLNILNDEADQGATTVARISIKRRVDAVNANGLIVDENGDSRPERIHWPIVRGNADLLEVLVEYGWGVRGVQTQTKESREWQLHLLRHLHAPDES